MSGLGVVEDLWRAIHMPMRPLIRTFFGQGWVPLQHFLLVLLVLSLNSAIDTTLRRYHLESEWLIKALLNFTDVVAVLIFCIESVVLLTLIAAGDIRDKWAELGQRR